MPDARAGPPAQVGTFGGATRQGVAGGVARFDDLSVNNPAPRYRLRFTAAAGAGTLAAESSDFTITGLVSALRVLQQPGGARGGEPLDLQPRLALIDAIGQVGSASGSPVRRARRRCCRPCCFTPRCFTFTLRGAEQVVSTEVRNVRATLEQGAGGGAALSPQLAQPASELGVVSYSDLAIDRAGAAYTLKFAVLGLPFPLSAESAPFAVLPGPPFAVVLLSQPAGVAAGVPLDPAIGVHVRDRGGNVVPSANGTLTILVLRAGALTEMLTAPAAFGEAVFEGPITAAGGGFQLEARFPAPGGAGHITATSAAFDVAIGRPALVEIAVQPGPGIVGRALSVTPVVEVLDSGRNLVLSYNGPVTVARAEGPSGSYPAGPLVVHAVGGVADFAGLSITDSAPSMSLRFTAAVAIVDVEPYSVAADSGPFAVTFAAQALAVLTQLPRGWHALGGAPLSLPLEVAFRDGVGAVVEAVAAEVAVSLTSADARLSGALSVTAAAGVATFRSLVIDTVGSYELLFVARAEGAELTARFPVQIKVGAVSALRITQEPAHAMNDTVFFSPVDPAPPRSSTAAPPPHGPPTPHSHRTSTTTPPPRPPSAAQTVPTRPFSPRQVTARFFDLGGNVVPSVTDVVSVALGQNAHGARLSGTTARAAVAGVATFGDLSVDRVRNGYTLVFSAPGGLRAESARFSVQGEVTSLGVVAFPAGVLLNTRVIPAPRVAILSDALNVVVGGPWRPPYVLVSVAILDGYVPAGCAPADCPLTFSPASTTAVMAVRGVATFDNLEVFGNTNYQGARLRFSSNASAATVDSPFFSSSFDENELVLDQAMAAYQTTGLTLVPHPALTLYDGTGKAARGSIGTCTAALSAGGPAGLLAGTTSFPARAGRCVYTDLSIALVGEYALAFSATIPDRADPSAAPTLLAAASPAFNVSIGPAATLAVFSQPVAPPPSSRSPRASQSVLTPPPKSQVFASSGLPFSAMPCVELRDAGGNLIAAPRRVRAALAGPPGAELRGALEAPPLSY